LIILILGILFPLFGFYVWGSLLMFTDYRTGENGFSLALVFGFGTMAFEAAYLIAYSLIKNIDFMIIFPKIFILGAVLYLLYVNRLQRSKTDDLPENTEKDN